MFSINSSLAAKVLLDRSSSSPAPAADLDAYCAVLVAVDDAAAWAWNGTPVHVEPFFQSGDDTPAELFVTARFGALAASLMVELDTDRLVRADTSRDVLEMVGAGLNAAQASLFRSFPPASTLQGRLPPLSAPVCHCICRMSLSGTAGGASALISTL